MTDRQIEFLLVDDNEHDVTAIKRIWEKIDPPHRLRVVPGGDTCLRFLQDRHAGNDRLSVPPLVVILDDKMATKDGIEILKEIRQDDTLCHIPVLMLMGSNETYRKMKTYRMGANAYMVKPTGIEELKETLEIIIRFWELAELPTNSR